MQYSNTAQGLAGLGRNGDSMLMHVSPNEVSGLQSLAQSNGTTLTTNPNTGMPEAFNLGSILPMAAGLALGPAGFGAMSALNAGLLVGGLTALSSGDLGQGLMAGFGAYGGAELGSSFANAGKEITAGGLNTTTGAVNTGNLAAEGVTGGFSPIDLTVGGNNLTTAGGLGTGLMGAPLASAGTFNPALQSATTGTLNTASLAQQGLGPNFAQNVQFGVGGAERVMPELMQQANLTPTIGSGTSAIKDASGSLTQNSMRQYNPNASYDAFDFRPSTQTTNPSMSSNPIQPYNPPPTTNSVSPNLTQSGPISDYNYAKTGFNKLTEDPSAFFDAYKRGNAVDGIPLTNTQAGFKIGMAPATSILGGLEYGDIYGDSSGYNITDDRFRGPEGQLNLSGATGLRLPLYAKTGGHIKGYNQGGIAMLAEGKMIDGEGDGVSDEVVANIDGHQEARLSDGEFVVPARIVSELGNGSSEAGAEKLYAWMDKIQNIRAKTLGDNFAMDTNAERYLPA
jgi:hypothetical protein